MAERSRPLLVYDGDCDFCREWIARWRALTGDRVAYAPYQEVAGEFPPIPIDQFRRAVQLIEPDGSTSSGAEAVFRALQYAPHMGWMLWIYQRIPGAAAVSEAAYRFIAAHRPAGYGLTRWLFLRLLGLVYLFAFWSLSVQILGLVGSRGVLPAGLTDNTLRLLCLAGIAVSLSALIGFLPVPSFALLWLLYFLLVNACQDFLAFQWDILLLETGFLAILFAPRGPPSRLVLWLLRLLLFRLMFSSGVVKLSSGDPTWSNLTALRYHYETQPLPTPIAWYAHQLPAWFQAFSTFLMFGIELAVPFFIFLPRRLRFAGAAVIILFEGLIALTGNYAFFNLLTVALCITLLDDALLRRLVPSRFAASGRQRSTVGKLAAAIVGLVILLGGAVQIGGLLWGFNQLPRPAARLFSRLSNFYLVNRYGLFAVMTTTRAEIILQGSHDGETWLDYEFKYKPGDLQRPPPWVAPHQPRLDWQMWFAALGNYQSNPWFEGLVLRLLQGSPDVLALLEKNPFPAAPPRYVRAVLYDYHFTGFPAKRRDGTWWRRTYLGVYFPAVSLPLDCAIER